LLDLDVAPRLVAVCDTNPVSAAWFRDNVPGIGLVTDRYEELLADPAVEAVYVAVPHNLHARIYIDCLLAGKHLLGEKPFGIDQAANAQILEVARARPELLVRCSSELAFFPGAQRIVQMIRQRRFGTIMEVQAGFLHASDLDPRKPINWKRQIATNGAYGCMGDLGMHVLFVPLRFGWVPRSVYALLSNVIRERPGPDGQLVPCDTWDNAALACQVESAGQRFPLMLETKRIAPGETNTWYLRVYGTALSAEFSTKYPKTLRTLPYAPGSLQAWQSLDLGYESAYSTISGSVFEFGFSDSLLQMYAAFCDELVHHEGMRQPFYCVTPEETALSHAVFTAALESERTGQAVWL
jgi:predicted dehydrogenase